MKKRSFLSDRVIGIGIVILVIGVVGYNLFLFFGPSIVLNGKEVPSVTGFDMSDRTVKTLPVPEGVVILHFWATWCGACVGEIPLLNQYASDIKIIGIAKEPFDAALASRLAPRFPSIIGNEAVFEEFMIFAFPTSLILRDRKIEKVIHGVMSEKELRECMGKFLIYLCFFLAAVSCADPEAYYSVNRELEPNNDQSSANWPVFDEQVYTGTVNQPVEIAGKKSGDVDFFRIYGWETGLYTIEFESAQSGFTPFVTIADTYGILPKQVFPVGGSKQVFKYYNPHPGWIYLMVGDARNIGRTTNFYGSESYRYWFRVSVRSICAEPAEQVISAGIPAPVSDDRPLAGPLIFHLSLPEEGYYGFSYFADDMNKSSVLLITDCFTGEVVGGSDGIAPVTGNIIPYIYKWIGGIHRYIGTVDWSTIRSGGNYAGEVLVEKQEPGKEFEPNDSFTLGTILSGDVMSGDFSLEKNRQMVGRIVDTDYFAVAATAGEVIRF